MTEVASSAPATTQSLYGRAAPLADKWGGRLPSWEEFREAASRNMVRIDIHTAEQAMILPEVRTALIFYNGVVMLAALISLFGPPIAWWFGALSGWWILLGFAASAYLGRFARWGRTRTVFRAALKDPFVYMTLIGTGIFDFDPR